MVNPIPRIVSLLPAATEIVCGIGLGSQLVGVSHACHWPPAIAHLPRVTRSRIDSTVDSAGIDVQVRSLLRTGVPLYEIDEALLAQLRPDLIITQSHCEVCAVSVQAVERVTADCKMLALTRMLALNPQSLADVLGDIQRIGDAAEATVAASEFAASLRSRVAAIESATARRGDRPRPRVAVIEWIEPLMIAGNWTPELAALAGGDYGLAVSGKPSPEVSWREMAQYAPELLIIAPCGFDFDRSLWEAQQLPSKPGWTSLPAARHGHVHVVDGEAFFNCPGPRLVDTLELLAQRIRDVMI